MAGRAAIARYLVRCHPVGNLAGHSVVSSVEVRFGGSMDIGALREKQPLLQQNQYTPSSAAGDVLQVDHWIEYANLLVNGPGLDAVCGSINEYLSLRVYLAGHSLSAGDVVCWAQLAGRPSHLPTAYHMFHSLLLALKSLHLAAKQ